jgi:hypothetical protein
MIHVVITMKRKNVLLQMIAALHRARCLARRLHGRQQERDQSADDRDDNEKLHERKRPFSASPNRFCVEHRCDSRLGSCGCLTEGVRSVIMPHVPASLCRERQRFPVGRCFHRPHRGLRLASSGRVLGPVSRLAVDAAARTGFMLHSPWPQGPTDLYLRLRHA